MKLSNKRLFIIIALVLLLLLIPLVAMQFTHEVNWSRFDFIIASILLLGIGLIIEFILRRTKQYKQRAIWILISLIILILVWLELAVGLLGSPLSGN